MDIYEKVEDIKTKNEFVDFLKVLKKDLAYKSEEWANDNLEAFLEGLYGYSFDTKEEASWKTFAKILLAAKNYE
ncbi:MAG: hypothetical protein H6627_14935 [Calditrichae bacterium]|nr:hypothetical protein [Calditrichia bacterium]